MEDCSRISTQLYKSAPENLSEIARQLGVAHILEGSVQKSGDVVRVNVQLFKAANDEDADALVCNQQCCGRGS
jgi:TolB-like protein